MLKEKRRLQIEFVAVVTERAIQRKEEEEKRHEETKRVHLRKSYSYIFYLYLVVSNKKLLNLLQAAAKKLQMLDERISKSQSNEKKDREDSTTTVVPLPNWLDKNRQGDSDRDRSRTSSEGVDDKSRHEGSDFRSNAQVN